MKGLQNHMITYEKLRKKALYFDKLFPHFFVNGVTIFNEYNTEMMKRVEENGYNVEDLTYSYEEALCKRWILLLDRFYPIELEAIDLEDLYLLSELLTINDTYYSFYPHAGEERPYISPQNETFLELVERYDYEILLEHLTNAEKHQSPSLEFEDRWKFRRNVHEESLNFAINDTCGDVPCDTNLIKNFFWYGEQPKSRHNINFDYTLKAEGLYQGVIHPDIDPQKRQRWIEDFIALTELVTRGKYKIDDDTFDMETLPWINNDSRNDIDIVRGAAYSYQTCIIYFVNYITTPNNETFHKLVRMVYLTATNVYVTNTINQDISNSNAEEIIRLLYDFAQTIFEECQTENDCNLKLNCLPEYHNTGYLTADYIPPHHRQSSIYSDELIQQYAEKPSRKERKCMEIACTLIQNGYKRNDSEYVVNFFNKNKEYEKFELIYHKMYELAIVQELLYILYDAILINSEIVSHIPNIKRLCSKIQDFIYEDRGYDAIENELNKFSGNSFALANSNYELDIHRQFILILNSELTVHKSLDSLLQLKHEFTTQILNRGINHETKLLFEDINNKILFMVEQKALQDSLYSNANLEISLLVDTYISLITQKIQLYIGNTTFNCNHAFVSFKKTLTTAEFLYKKYVLPYTDTALTNLPIEVQNMDFSCIALEYYAALEQLTNILLFIPYREKVLQPRYSSCSPHQFDFHMHGYVGFSKENHLVDSANHQIKNSLELGNLAFLYKDSLDNNGNVKSKFAQIGDYINSLSLNIADVKNVSEKIYDIRKLRNEAAHGGSLLDINRAKKAQDVTFLHTPNPDSLCQINIADQCHELIIELLQLYT